MTRGTPEQANGFRCQRCRCETLISSGSYFNTEQICPACIEAEQAHPDYERAKAIERQAVEDGNYNYPGVGLPAELREQASARARARELDHR